VLLVLTTLQESLESIARFLRLDAAELGRKLIQVAVIWVLAWMAWWVVKAISRRIERSADDGDPKTLTMREQQGHNISQLLRSVGKMLIVSLALLSTLDVFVNIGPFLAGAGILGLAFSFGAQSLVKDVISGFFIQVENQFAVGDLIEIAGRAGVVEEMTLRVVMIRDGDGVLHIVPNGQITTVSNKTRSWGRAVVDVGVAYETDVDRALTVLKDELTSFAADPVWQARLSGAPEVLGVEGLMDSAVLIRTRAQTTAGSQWDVARELRRRFKNRLDQEGIEIPYPQRTLHVRSSEEITRAAAARALGD
jgi:small conductance mechanosensitive channel